MFEACNQYLKIPDKFKTTAVEGFWGAVKDFILI